MIESIVSDKAPEQGANVAFLPGIVRGSLAMPDIHWGYGFCIGDVCATDPARDVENTEARGRMEGADPDAVSPRARERGSGQCGTSGGGNHFVEMQVVDEIFDEAEAMDPCRRSDRRGERCPPFDRPRELLYLLSLHGLVTRRHELAGAVHRGHLRALGIYVANRKGAIEDEFLVESDYALLSTGLPGSHRVSAGRAGYGV